MNAAPARVVFDCNVYFQALTSPRGPAARLVDFALSGDISLFVSEYTLDELADVAARPHLVAKYGLEEAVVAKFISNLRGTATCINSVPHIFDFPRDPDDAHYVDLAVAANAKLIVSRDKDLLSQPRPMESPSSLDFRRSRYSRRPKRSALLNRQLRNSSPSLRVVRGNLYR